MTCWLCGHPIADPPDIIGHWHATQARVAHRHCLRTLGEYDLDLRTDQGADDDGRLLR